jgi:hypothetical protein
LTRSEGGAERVAYTVYRGREVREEKRKRVRGEGGGTERGFYCPAFDCPGFDK